MIKILVTGSNGLLGQKLISLLASDQEVEVVATARVPIKPIARVKFERLDITDPGQVDRVMAAERPAIVIHAAAMTQVDQCEVEQANCSLTNTTAVEWIVHACEKIRARLIYISTDFVFDGSHGPLDETATPNPISHYGKSKLAGEDLVQNSHLDWAILRTVLVYGITQDMSRSNIVLWVKKSLEEGKTINVVTDQWRTPTLAEDLAMGCLLAAKKKAKGIYHVSGEEMMTPYDIAIRTAHFFHLDKSLIKATDSNHFKQPAKRPPKTGFIIDKAKRELGYKPHTFEQGLEIVRMLGVK